jgi:uncharacterized protein YjbI with pentapeptide repeats
MFVAQPISAVLRRRSVAPSEFRAIIRTHEMFVSGKSPGAKCVSMQISAPGMRCDNHRLMDIDLAGSDLSRTTFIGTDLTRAKLSGALLIRCDFRAAILRRADLSGASLGGAQLMGAVLDHADLRGANLALLSEDLDQQLARFCASLKGSSLNEAQLDDVDAQGVDFTACSLKAARLFNADLTGANFTDANLDGVDLTGAKLAGVKLQGAILTNVDVEALGLPPETLAGCVRDPSRAALDRAGEIRSILDAAQQWIETDGGSGARGQLEGMDLRVVGDAFRKRKLTGLFAPRTVAVAVDFSDTQLQGANFDGADLRRADFCGADLRGASFIGANLSHARFSGAGTGPLTLPDGRQLPTRFDGARLEGCDLGQAAGG